jgi:hypothetical protein
MDATGPDGQTYTIAAGEHIDDFDSWPYVTQHALLRMGRVKQLGAHHIANLTTAGGYLHFEDAPPADTPRTPGTAPPGVRPRARMACELCDAVLKSERGMALHIAKYHPVTA